MSMTGTYGNGSILIYALSTDFVVSTGNDTTCLASDPYTTGPNAYSASAHTTHANNHKTIISGVVVGVAAVILLRLACYLRHRWLRLRRSPVERPIPIVKLLRTHSMAFSENTVVGEGTLDTKFDQDP
jgi:hypothetical protein